MNNVTPQPTVKESLTAQKPRCPVPVHEWPSNAMYCTTIHLVDSTYFLLRDNNGHVVWEKRFNLELQELNPTWTRAEALASQMLPAPDRAGVWLIDCSSGSRAPLRSDVFESVEIHKGYEIKGYVRSVYGLCWSVETGARFYYMGPLPTVDVDTESEVPSE